MNKPRFKFDEEAKSVLARQDWQKSLANLYQGDSKKKDELWDEFTAFLHQNLRLRLAYGGSLVVKKTYFPKRKVTICSFSNTQTGSKLLLSYSHTKHTVKGKFTYPQLGDPSKDEKKLLDIKKGALETYFEDTPIDILMGKKDKKRARSKLNFITDYFEVFEHYFSLMQIRPQLNQQCNLGNSEGSSLVLNNDQAYYPVGSAIDFDVDEYVAQGCHHPDTDDSRIVRALSNNQTSFCLKLKVTCGDQTDPKVNIEDYVMVVAGHDQLKRIPYYKLIHLRELMVNKEDPDKDFGDEDADTIQFVEDDDTDFKVIGTVITQSNRLEDIFVGIQKVRYDLLVREIEDDGHTPLASTAFENLQNAFENISSKKARQRYKSVVISFQEEKEEDGEYRSMIIKLNRQSWVKLTPRLILEDVHQPLIYRDRLEDPEMWKKESNLSFERKNPVYEICEGLIRNSTILALYIPGMVKKWNVQNGQDKLNLQK